MGTAWADEADRRARALTEELAERHPDAVVEYQRREARFVVRCGGHSDYFSAHDFQTRAGEMNWKQLREAIVANATAGR